MESGTPWWITVLVALLSPTAVLISQWLNNRRQEREATAGRAERAVDRRGTAYAEFLRTARSLNGVLSAGESPQSTLDTLDMLGQAAAEVELLAPDPVSTAVLTALGTGRQLARAAANSAPNDLRLVESVREYDEAVATARAAMRADLGIAALPVR